MAPIKKRSNMWLHFTELKNNKAQCGHCLQTLSIPNRSIGNLSRHMKLKHPMIQIVLERQSSTATVSADTDNGRGSRSPSPTNNSANRRRHFTNPVHAFFKKNAEYSICKICDKQIKGENPGNLLSHLAKHPDQHAEVTALIRNQDVCVKEQPASDDEEAEPETFKITDIWQLYEREGIRAVCVVCREGVSTDYEEMKGHLLSNHPNQLLELAQDQDTSDADNNDDNRYTEVVYLEDALADVPQKIEKRRSVTHTSHTSHTSHKIPLKRERQYSSSDDRPLKKKPEENTELQTFISYITVLLKKMPQDLFSKVQADVLNVILNAKNNHPTYDSHLNANGSIVFSVPSSTGVINTSSATAASIIINRNDVNADISQNDKNNSHIE